MENSPQRAVICTGMGREQYLSFFKKILMIWVYDGSMEPTPSCPTRRRSGFTLIELSIVLVIIGLIVGGIMVGRDLIKAAEARKVVATIGGYQTAVQTFRLKLHFPGFCE